MGSDVEKNMLGGFANALSLLVKEHPQTKIVFETVKSKFSLFSDIIRAKSDNAIEIFQTGSSFDDLHLCRNFSGDTGQEIFFPPTDFDFMMVYTTYLVGDFTEMKIPSEDKPNQDPKLQHALKNFNGAFLMIPTNHMGYVRLLVTDKGREMLKDKIHGQAITHTGYLPSTIFRKTHEPEPNTEVIYRRVPVSSFISSGPALSNFDHELQGYTYDFVFSFPCKEWPAIANKWSKRPRDAKWPSQDLIDEIVADGCSVVPVGFYTSPHSDLEWRLSFNLSERKLSRALTRNQRTCYCIVKLVIKTSLSENAVLSSYMVKNMMFWFCEQQYGDGHWEDHQLGERILQLVDYIITALEHHNIPHYFLPRNNLIDHKAAQEVQSTIADLICLKANPFKTLISICKKMKVFEMQKDTKGIATTGNEIQTMLTLFIGFVQTIFQLGMLNYDVPDFSIRCFQNVVEMNIAAKSLIKTGSQLFTSLNIVDLLKPFAIQFMQAGEVDKALSLFKMMLMISKEFVTVHYPEAIANVACLESCKIDIAQDKRIKEELKKSAHSHFIMAMEYIKDSPSLHLAYGNFLKDSEISILTAIDQYRSAIAISVTRPDDDALLQITLPGEDATKAEVVYMPGKVVAYFSLIGILMRIGDVYEARDLARKLESLVSTLDGKIRKQSTKLCFHVFVMVGLPYKAHLVLRSGSVKEM